MAYGPTDSPNVITNDQRNDERLEPAVIPDGTVKGKLEVPQVIKEKYVSPDVIPILQLDPAKDAIKSAEESVKALLPNSNQTPVDMSESSIDFVKGEEVDILQKDELPQNNLKVKIFHL